MMFVGFYLAREHTHDNNQNASSMRDRIQRRSGLSKFSVCISFFACILCISGLEDKPKTKQKNAKNRMESFLSWKLDSSDASGTILWSAKLSVITSQQVIRVEYAMPKSWAILFQFDRMIVPLVAFHRFQNFFTIFLSTRCGEMISFFYTFFARIVFERKSRIINYRV